MMGNSNTIQPLVKQHINIPQLLSIKDVSRYTGLSRSTIYELINEKSYRYDPNFPKKVQLTRGRVAWVADEVAQWISSKIEARVR